MNEILQTTLILTLLCLAFGTVLAVAHKKLKVFEDPRIDAVEEMLPSANCGACGYPGCRAFAEKVVSGEINPGKCTVSSSEGIIEIADYLGVTAVEEEKRVARLLCAGGINESHHRSSYTSGIETCRAESVVAGGSKDCSWGCLGLGDCVKACTFEAIHMNSNGLPQVSTALCTACGDCVTECPKDLFEILPLNQHLIVQCKSQLEGDGALERCSVACTACGKCALDAPGESIVMKNGLPEINPDKLDILTPEVTLRCPTGAITWLVGDEQFNSQYPLWDLMEVSWSEKNVNREYFQ